MYTHFDLHINSGELQIFREVCNSHERLLNVVCCSFFSTEYTFIVLHIRGSVLCPDVNYKMIYAFTISILYGTLTMILVLTDRILKYHTQTGWSEGLKLISRECDSKLELFCT